MANASVYEVCSGSQPASAAASLIVGIGSQDSSLQGSTGRLRTLAAGDLVVVFIGSDNVSGTPTGVIDSKGNTWTQVQNQVGAVNQQFQVYASVIAAGKVPTGADTITGQFASSSGTHHLIAKAIIGPSSATPSNAATTQGSGGGTWSSGQSGALSGTKVVCGFLINASAGGKPSAITFDSATATVIQCPSGHWATFMVDSSPPGAGEAAGGTTVSGTWAAGVLAFTAAAPVTGTGTIKSKKIALAGAGTVTPPVTGTGAISLPGAPSIVLAGAATYTPPVTGTGIAAKKIALAGAGVYTGPYDMHGGIVAKKIQLAGAGTYTPQPVTGTGAIAAKKIALAGTGTYTPPPTTGTGAIAAKKIKLAGTGAITPPTTGTGSFHAKKIALAGSGGVIVPITGTGALAAKKIALAGLGTYTPGATTGTGSFHAKKIALAGAGVSNIAPTTGLGSFHAKKIQLAGIGRIGTAPAGPRVLSSAPPELIPVIWDGLSLNDGQRDDGLCTVVTSVDGWYGSPPLAGNDLDRVLSDGALFGVKTLAARLLIITGAATGPRDLVNAFARSLGGKAAGRSPGVLLVGEDDGTDEPGALQAAVRADSDSLAVAWKSRIYFTYQVSVTAADPRLYDSGANIATLSPLPSNAATGRPYPLIFPRFYASANVANTLILSNAGNAPAPVLLTYTGALAESRLTDGTSTIHLAPLGPSQQVYVNSETLITTAPGGANRASYLLARGSR